MEFVIKFDSAEEMAAFVAEKTGQPMELRYAVTNGLPQTVRLVAEPLSTDHGPVINLHIVSRGTPDQEGMIELAPGDTKAI